MDLVIAIILGLVLLLYCVNDNNKIIKKHDDYIKYEAPPALQEEYMSACEYYYQYCMQPEAHQDPRVDAKYDAGYKVYQMGYKPSGVGREYFYDTAPEKYADRVPYSIDKPSWWNTSGDNDIRGTPNKTELLSLREQDSAPRGFRDGLPHYLSVGENKYDKRKGHKERMNDAEWKEYCDRIDARMDALRERCEEDGWWNRYSDLDAWRKRAIEHTRADIDDGIVELNIPEERARLYEARNALVNRLSFAVRHDE